MLKVKEINLLMFLLLLSNYLLLKSSDKHEQKDNSINGETEIVESKSSPLAKVIPVTDIQNIIIDYLKQWDKVKTFKNDPYESHLSVPVQLMYSPNNKHLATVSIDNVFRIWNVETYDLLKVLRKWRGVTSAVYSPDGKYLAEINNYSHDEYINIRDVNNDYEIINKVKEETANHLTYSSNNMYFAYSNFDGTIKILDATNYKLLHAFKSRTMRSIGSLKFSPDNKSLAISYNFPKRINILDLDEISKNNIKIIVTLDVFGPDSAGYQIEYSPNNKYLASTDGDRTIKLWDVNDNYKLFRSIESQTGNINSISFSQNNKFLAGAIGDKTITLWDATTFKEMQTLDNSSSLVTPRSYRDVRASVLMAFAPNSEYLAVSGINGHGSNIDIWHYRPS